MTSTEMNLNVMNEDNKTILLSNFSYDTALLGVTASGNAVYSYDKMLEWLMTEQGMTYDEAVDWVGYNTIRSLPYYGAMAPVIVYPLVEE